MRALIIARYSRGMRAGPTRGASRGTGEVTPGAWKGARTVEDIPGRSTRTGAHGERMRRIGQ